MFSFLLAANILKNSQGFFAACRFKFYMIINYINQFHAAVSFNTPWKHQKFKGFLMFLGGIEWDQWHEMGWLKRYISVKQTNTHRKKIFILEWSIICQFGLQRMEIKFKQSCEKMNNKILILNLVDSFFPRYCETSEDLDHVLTYA